MTVHTIAEIADATGLAMVGDGSVRVARPCPPEQAAAEDLAVAMSAKFAEKLQGSPARAAVLWEGADYTAYGLKAALIAPRPRVAMARVTGAFAHAEDLEPGIHPSAHIAADAELGADVWIGPFVVVGSGARIGAGGRIAGYVLVGADARIGARTTLRAGARIGARCWVGNDVLVHENAVTVSYTHLTLPTKRIV